MMNARTTTFPGGLQFPVEGLRVNGEALREAPPEMVELGFEIHGMGLTAAFALQDCVVRTMQTGQALTGIGIPQTDLQAGPMGVRSIPFAPALNPHPFAPALNPHTPMRPLLNAPYSALGGLAPFSPAHAQLHQPSGYDATSSVKVLVRELIRLAEVVDAVTGSGSTVLASIRFLLQDEAKLRRSLFEDAVRQAREKADILAAAFGKTVGNPISIDEDFRVYQPNPLYADGYSPYSPGVPPFPFNMTRHPFTFGQLAFHASVGVTYQFQ